MISYDILLFIVLISCYLAVFFIKKNWISNKFLKSKKTIRDYELILVEVLRCLSDGSNGIYEISGMIYYH